MTKMWETFPKMRKFTWKKLSNVLSLKIDILHQENARDFSKNEKIYPTEKLKKLSYLFLFCKYKKTFLDS